MRKQIVFLTSLLLTFTMIVSAQDKGKRPSPAAQAQCKFSNGKTITIDYSSPRAKGRKIFGTASENALVPYGEVWRTGANEATTFVTDANLSVGGKDVPAGSYTIFTVPNADKWTLIVAGALMIEPTESEPKEELDLFIEAMKSIAEEVEEDPQFVLDAPHNTRISRLDETAAARKPVLRWRKA